MLRKIQQLTLLTIMLLLTTACSSPAQQVNLTIADKGSQVEIKAGGQIVVTLEGNPSTGYTWEAKDLDITMFKQVGDPTFINSNPGLVGSGGTMTLTYEALKAGTATLTLIYHRPWEAGVEPIDTYTVIVTVK